MSHSQIQQFAQKGFVVHDGKLLCVRKSEEEPTWPLHWEIPGGRMEFGEEVDDHFCREVKEETNLEIIPGRPFYIWQWVFNRKGNLHQVVAVARLATLKNKNDFTLSMDNHDQEDFIDRVEWVPLEQLKTKKWIPNLIPVMEAFLALPEITIK